MYSKEKVTNEDIAEKSKSYLAKKITSEIRDNAIDYNSEEYEEAGDENCCWVKSTRDGFFYISASTS